jgi:hypothetical protein
VQIIDWISDHAGNVKAVHALPALTGGYCNNHPATSNCSGNSLPAEIIGALIVAVLVLLVVLWWIWRHSDPDAENPSLPGRGPGRQSGRYRRASGKLTAVDLARTSRHRP